jgi:hypothetical protein
MQTMTTEQSQSQLRDNSVILLREHLERLLQERKDQREQIEKLRNLAEQQQEKIRELKRQAV